MSKNGHVPAQNLEAEENVIGAMLVSARAIEAAQEHVHADDFYNTAHSVIYSTCVDMHDRQLPVDAVTLHNELERTGKLEEVGGKARLHQLAGMVPATANTAHYARIVRDQALLRSLTRAGAEIGRLGSGAAGDIDDLLHQAEQALSDVALRGRGAGAVSITEGFDDYLNEVREAYSTGVARTGTLTGYPPLDELLSGLWPGQLVLIAARPAQGKSTLAFNISENLADDDKPVLFVSLEMLRRELQERGLARAARVDSRNLRSGKMSPPEAARLTTGIEKVKSRDGKLLIHDEGYVTVPELKALVTRHHRQHGIKLAVVDYIQLITPPQADNRNLEIGQISRALKLLAMRLHIPIIAVCQMSRAIETRGGADRRPMLSDLRDSGSLEQDADVVVFLHDPSSYDMDKAPDGTIEVIVAKNRQGGSDTVKLGYVRKFSSFQHIPDKPEGGEA